MRAGDDLDPVAGPARITCFRLDIGVFDKARFELAFDREVAFRVGRRDVAFFDAPVNEEVFRTSVVEQGRIR